MVGDGVVRHHQEYIEHLHLVPVVIHGWINWISTKALDKTGLFGRKGREDYSNNAEGKQ